MKAKKKASDTVVFSQVLPREVYEALKAEAEYEGYTIALMARRLIIQALGLKQGKARP